MKIKIKPSARIKRRYLLFKGGTKSEIEKVILDYIGILGWAKASPVFVKSNILAVERKMVEDIKASFELCKKDIEIKKTSGTLKGLK